MSILVHQVNLFCRLPHVETSEKILQTAKLAKHVDIIKSVEAMLERCQSHRKAAVQRNLAEQNQKTAEEKKMDNNGKRCFKKEGLGVGIWHSG